MIYFKKVFDYNNGNVSYSVDDFINEPDVRKVLYRVKYENDECNEIPVMAYITIQFFQKQYDNSFLLKDKHVVLVIQTRIDYETNKKYRLYSSEAIYNHVKALIDLMKPEDKLCSIELSDGKII
jgi:hypothetical protein